MNQNSAPSPQEAARELLSRRLSRRSLLPFIEYSRAGYKPAGHHRRICDALEAVERGELDRLAIFMPPRHGKSEIASRRFPAWYIGRNPAKQIVTASYNSELATDFGREVRNIVASQEYAKVFPDVVLSPDSKAADRWHTSQGGCYVAAGVGTSLTGRGADLALIDDPVKDRAEADSELIRNRVWNWYRSVLYTRLMPKASIVLIQTRWHEDDLAGRVLNEKGEKWHVIDMPALTDGQALWPEWYDVEALARIRSAIGEREFSALYQQRPVPDEGTFFKREWFKFYATPPNCHKYITGDFAVTEGAGDWTELGVHGLDSSGDLYLLIEGWFGQTTADKWIDSLCTLIQRHKPLSFFGESGPIRRSIEPFLVRRMRERRANCRLEWITRTADKPTMARSLQAMASMGKVWLPDNEHGHRLLAQLLAFPAGKADDAVDMAALMAMAMDQAHPAVVKQAERPRIVDRYRWDDNEESSWKTA